MSDKPFLVDICEAELDELMALIKKHVRCLQDGEVYDIVIVNDGGHFNAKGRKGRVGNDASPDIAAIQKQRDLIPKVAGCSIDEKDEVGAETSLTTNNDDESDGDETVEFQDEEYEDALFSQRQDVAYDLHSDDN